MSRTFDARRRGAGIGTERIRGLNDADVADGDYVLYWMQADPRAVGNHALAYAILTANELRLPLVVAFGLAEGYPDANLRHYRFMLEGIRETAAALEARGAAFVLRVQSPERLIVKLGRRAACVVTDRGYTRVQVMWRTFVASRLPCRFVQIESGVVVPAGVASEKREYSAATIRRKIQPALDDWLVPVRTPDLDVAARAGTLDLDAASPEDPDALLASMTLDRSVAPSPWFRGGTSEAEARLARFLDERLETYDADRNDPTLDGTSALSPYLHFGQIGALDVALAVRERGGPGAAPFTEQLVVRRELAVNFVARTPRYDAFACLPEWCRATLSRHGEDAREYVYDLADFEAAATHDPYWNAAQTQMARGGWMHNYMRMYWGKKILEWTARPEDGFRIARMLNDKYELDGRDPNGAAGVAWCFGLHDRPWKERPVFGTIRYMNARGLKRKFDADAYVRKVAAETGDL